MKVSIIKGDISEIKADAVVNAADKALLGGGGVDGAIHKKAGKKLIEECKNLREEKFPDGLETGDAVATKAYKLNAKIIIHAVGPRYGLEEIGLLRNAYVNSLKIAEHNKCKTIAFPAISTGAFKMPIEVSARIVKEVMDSYNSEIIEHVFLVLHTEKDYEVYNEEFKK